MLKLSLKLLTRGSLFGAGAWFISNAGLMISYLTYKIGGFIVGPIFYWLAGWPLAIYSLFLPSERPDWYYQNAFYIGCLVSLAGWLIVSIFISFAFHIYTISFPIKPAPPQNDSDELSPGNEL